MPWAVPGVRMHSLRRALGFTNDYLATLARKRQPGKCTTSKCGNASVRKMTRIVARDTRHAEITFAPYNLDP